MLLEEVQAGARLNGVVPGERRRCIEGSLVTALRASAHGQIARATSVNASRVAFVDACV
jgi:hypothetical protein